MERIKIASLIIVVVMLMLILPIEIYANAQTSSWDGTTITQPTSMKTIDGVYYYEISTAEELAYIAKTGGDWLAYNYILANDITLNSVALTYDTNGNLTVDASTLNQWTPIKGFNGIFDGAGYTISGVYVNTTSTAGFFVEFSGGVSNLTITNSYIKGVSKVGGICGFAADNSKDMANCYFDGAVIGEGDYVGGLIGHAGTVDVSDSGNYGDVWGLGRCYVAGIIGCGGFHINNCFNEGNVYSTGDYVAGIIGSSRHDIYSCTNKGNITGNNYVGGVCGEIEMNDLSRCGNTGNISGTQYVGGICGYSTCYAGEDYWGPSIYSDYNTGNVTGESFIGGITGYANYADISDCYNAGNVVGTSTTGAIIGHSESIWGKGMVSCCYYLKTSDINTNLLAFGNATTDTDSVTSKDDSFFCVNSDKTLNKKGHTYSSTVPCDATCDTCGYERTATHIFYNVKYDSDKHWYECDCGEKKVDSEASHTGGTATCTKKAKCDVCKQSYGHLNTNNHTTATNWKNADDQHYHICTNGCGAKLDIANCADTDKNYKCDVCGKKFATETQNNSVVSDTPINPFSNNNGCGSVISETSISVIAIISIGALGVITKKRKHY